MPTILMDVVTIRGVPVTSAVAVGLTVTTPTAAAAVIVPRSGRFFAYTLPEETQSFRITAASDPYWPADLSVSYSPGAGGRSSVSHVGIAHSIDKNTVGGVTTLTVTLVLQQVSNVTSMMGHSFSNPYNVMDVQAKILNPGGSGSSLFNMTPAKVGVTPQRLWVLKWKSTGTCIGVYVPQAGMRLGNYNLFFKPRRHLQTTTPDALGIYMTWQGDLLHKMLVAQTEISGSSYILCLAFEEDGPLPAYGSSQSGVVDLLEEIDYFLRLNLTGTQANPAVGKVALSCFSAGATRVAQIIGTAPTVLLGKVKGLFILDGNDFNVNMSSFGRDLALRIYVSEQKFKAIPQKNLAGAVTSGPGGSFEYRSPATISSGDPAVTYFYAPWEVWKTYDVRFANWMSVHQVIPGRFMSHALKSSGV